METSNAAGMHTCSYACERPECIRAQRDELASRLTAQQPEARGVVDEAMVRKVLDFKPSWSGVTVREYLIDGGAKFWSPSSYLWNDAGSKPYRIVQEALTAALTGERNG